MSDWKYFYKCPECSSVFGGMSKHYASGPCANCGCAADKVTISGRWVFEGGWLFWKRWRFEERNVGDDAAVSPFHRHLANLLDIEIDGGDDPAAYVRDMIEEASHLAFGPNKFGRFESGYQ